MTPKPTPTRANSAAPKARPHAGTATRSATAAMPSMPSTTSPQSTPSTPGPSDAAGLPGCPFCGADVVIGYHPGTDGRPGTWTAMCLAGTADGICADLDPCPVGPMAVGKTEAEAAAKWASRTPPTPPPAKPPVLLAMRALYYALQAVQAADWSSADLATRTNALALLSLTSKSLARRKAR